MSFDETFARLTADHDAHHKPFPWQRRLFDAWRAGERVDALDIPTGLGKTAAMAVWLLALSDGAPLSRKLVYVVDRRAVVDQATEYAQRLRRNLTKVQKTALGVEDVGLPVSTLRGGYADNRSWLADPSTPAIIVGTVDMIGSRLLFEGYGVSRSMRPFHAGLLGADTLLLLDEAHLSAPFHRMVEAVARLRGDAAPALHLTTLSATSGSPRGGTPLRLAADDRKHPVVRQRLEASKRLCVKDAPDASAASFVAHASALAEGSAPRVLVFRESRDEALKIATALEKAMKSADGARVEALTGARRGWERDSAAARLADLGFLAGRGGERSGPAFLVATAAGEVGIDLDADAMVCDLVAWERMVQRLGRVNRRGDGDAPVIVLDLGARAIPKRLGEEEPARRAATRALLARLPQTGDGLVQAGPGAIDALRRDAGDAAIAAASSPPPLHPPLEPATVQAWAMTSMKDHAGRPEVAPWLRGWVDDEPETTVLWRSVMPPVDSLAAATAFLAETPPHSSELLATLTSTVVDTAVKRAAKLLTLSAGDEALRPETVAAIHIDAALEAREAWSVRDLAAMAGAAGKSARDALFRAVAGATLLFDARLGGLSEGLLDAGADGPVATAESYERWRAATVDEDDPTPLICWRVASRAAATAPASPGPGWILKGAHVLHRDAEGEAQTVADVWRWRGETPADGRRSASGKPQSLEEHTAWVVEEVHRLSDRLSLPEKSANVLEAAARAHDLGKAAPRWRRAMRVPEGPALAKTDGRGNGRELGGYRHEFGSLLAADLSALPKEDRDLACHLIAAHHGHARPLIAPIAGGLPGTAVDLPPSAVAAAAREAALRFARLSDPDPWALAWLEALLRAADHRASARHEERRDHG